MEQIARRSLEELKMIFKWINEREKEPITVLVGGWAVYCYNPYWGSVDIDIITDSRTKSSLKNFLTKKKGYSRDPETTNSVFKDTPFGKVIIDIALRGEDIFEGKSISFPYQRIEGRIVLKPLEDQEVPVPDITFLLMMKVKAAWDRKWRLDNGISEDPIWETGKIVKDHSDIIALLECDESLDIGILGDHFKEYPFLRSVFEDIITSDLGSRKFNIDHEEVVQMIRKLSGLIT
jgi:hypothetical protein